MKREERVRLLYLGVAIVVIVRAIRFYIARTKMVGNYVAAPPSGQAGPMMPLRGEGLASVLTRA